MNPSTHIATNSFIAALRAGLERRESQVHSASGYFVREIYYSGDQRFYDAYENSSEFTDERVRQAFMRRVMKPPLLTQYFCAAHGQSVRFDQRDTSPENWRHEITSRVGKKQLHWSGWGAKAEKETIRETRGMSPIEDTLQIAIDQRTYRLTERIMGTPVHFVGIEKIGDIETCKIQYRIKEWAGEVTEWIAFNHGFLLVKRESRGDNEAFENTPFVTSRSVDVVDDIAEVKPGIWVPLVKRLISYGTFRDDPAVERWQTVTRWSVVSLTVNEEISKTIFRLPLPPGTHIISGSTLWRKTGLSHRTVFGDKAKFEAQLAEAKRRGEQPDLDSIDISSFNTHIAVGRPVPAELQDRPIQNLKK
jgi:hypothetical protein